MSAPPLPPESTLAEQIERIRRDPVERPRREMIAQLGTFTRKLPGRLPLARADYYNKLGPPKSAAGRRDIPLMPIVVNTLREWQVAYPCGPDGLVFCVVHHGAKGSVVHHQILWLAYRRAQRRAGVTDAAGQPKYHFHVLRHFFASIGIEAGFAPKRLQAVLGHASITMTYDVYGHLFPNPEDDYARLAAMERGVFGK